VPDHSNNAIFYHAIRPSDTFYLYTAEKAISFVPPRPKKITIQKAQNIYTNVPRNVRRYSSTNSTRASPCNGALSLLGDLTGDSSAF
jgi:hypothetical protein